MNTARSFSCARRKGNAVLGSLFRGVAACLVYVCTLIPWGVINKNAFKSIHYAEREIGATLRGVFIVHVGFLASGALFGTTIAGLLAVAIVKCRPRKGADNTEQTSFLHPADSGCTLNGQPSRPETEPLCQHLRAVCATAEVVYVGFSIWVFACVFCYSRWITGALAVADVAEFSLQQITTSATHGDSATPAARDPTITLAVAAGTRRLSGIDLSLRGSSEAVAEVCSAACLDLKQLEFLGSTMCVCEAAVLTELHDNATRLYNQLRAALSLLLVMYGSACTALIYTSALLGRADGRSELELVLGSEGNRDLPSASSSPMATPEAASDPRVSGAYATWRDCEAGAGLVRGVRACWGRVWDGEVGQPRGQELEGPRLGAPPPGPCLAALQGAERAADPAAASANVGATSMSLRSAWIGALGRCDRKRADCEACAVGYGARDGSCDGGGDGGKGSGRGSCAAVQARHHAHPDELYGVVHVCGHNNEPAAAAEQAAFLARAGVCYDRRKQC